MTDALEDARYAAMRWNTPLAEDHAALLLAALEVPWATSALDLGCGWGELLLRAVAAGRAGGSDCRGTGVDTDERLLARGRAAAQARGLSDAVSFVPGRAQDWRAPAEVVLCVGAAHAWGGAEPALAALRELVGDGGRLLFGDGCWERPPTDAAAALFGEDVMALEDLAAAARGAGWSLRVLRTATLQEWDAFESSWRAGREAWRTAHPDDPRAPGIADELAARQAEYESVYRGVLGFAYLVLA